MQSNHLFGMAYNKDTPIFILPKQPIFLEQFQQDILSSYQQIKTFPQERLALCFENSYKFCITLLAVLAANKQPILLPNNQSGTLQQFSCDYDAILSDIPTINSLPVNEGTAVEPNLTLTLSDTQPLIIYTSGSTGQPQKIQRTLTALMNELKILEKAFGERMQDAPVYSSVSHQHLYGLIFYILWPLYAGRSIAYPHLQYPECIENQWQRQNTILISCPTLLSRLTTKVNMQNQLIVFTSGSLLKKEIAQQLYDKTKLIPVEILGSTETSGIAYRQQILQPFWQALPTVTVAQDAISQCLSVTSSFFDDTKPVKLSDQIKMHENGLFELLGRVDRIKKIEGKRVSLDAIEQSLKTHPMIQDIYTLIIEDYRQSIAAVIALNATGNAHFNKVGKIALDQSIRKWLKQYFDAIVCPKKIRYVTEIPKNTQGKVVIDDIKRIFQQANISIYLPESSIYFQGHFPGNPILPGIAQVDLAIHHACHFYGLKPNTIAQIKQIKFCKLIKPETNLTLQLAKEETKIKFKFVIGEQVCSSGVLMLKGELS